MRKLVYECFVGKKVRPEKVVTTLKEAKEWLKENKVNQIKEKLIDVTLQEVGLKEKEEEE